MPIRADNRRIALAGPHADAVELAARRWERGACFANPDGTRTYICGGAPMHYQQDGEWREIDNRWQPSPAPWNYQMTACGYQAFALSRFDAGRMVRLERAGHYVTYQPMALNWSNDLDQIQQIAMPAPVDGAVTNSGADNLCQGGELRWSGAYGPGLDFTYTPSTHFFRKILSIDSLSRIGAPAAYITAGGNPVLQLNFVFASDLDLWIDGAKWDASSRRDTASIVEFRDTARLCHWWWAVPHATDADGKTIAGTLRVKRQGASLYVSVLVPHAWLAGAEYPVRVDPDTYYGETTDGHIDGLGSVTYNVTRTTSDSFTTTGTTMRVGQWVDEGTYYIHRTYLEFDTSAIDDGATVTQANLYLTCTNDWSTTDFTVRVHKYDWTSPIASGNMEANYDGALASTYDADWRSTSGMSTGTSYGSSNLDTTWVKKLAGEKTRYALLSNEDIGNSPPSNDEWILVATQSHATEAYRPYLSVTVEAGGEEYEGGGEASVIVSAEGAGTKAGVGAGEAPVVVTPEGAGTKSTQGAAESSVIVSAEGAGVKHAEGGRYAYVVIGGQGAGTKTAQGSGEAGTVISPEGAGTKGGVGGAEASVVVAADGAGMKAGLGAGEASVVVAPEGAGSSGVSGGGEAKVVITPEGAGVKHAQGGGYAIVYIGPVGAGRKWATGGADAQVIVCAEGAGEKGITGSVTLSLGGRLGGGGVRMQLGGRLG